MPQFCWEGECSTCLLLGTRRAHCSFDLVLCKCVAFFKTLQLSAEAATDNQEVIGWVHEAAALYILASRLKPLRK
jgi:hypothetical protein